MRNFNLGRVIFASILLTFMQSCSTENIEKEEEPIIHNEVALNKFNQLLKVENRKLNESLSPYLSSSRSTANIDYEQLSEEDAEEYLKPIIEGSLDLLVSSGFSEDEIKEEVGSLEDPALFFAAFTVLLNADEHGVIEGSIANIESNGFMYCLGSASGIYGIWELATGAATASRRAILRAVGKFARRSLGWVGAALFIGEFVQCYWGGNSSFENKT